MNKSSSGYVWFVKWCRSSIFWDRVLHFFPDTIASFPCCVALQVHWLFKLQGLLNSRIFLLMLVLNTVATVLMDSALLYCSPLCYRSSNNCHGKCIRASLPAILWLVFLKLLKALPPCSFTVWLLKLAVVGISVISSIKLILCSSFFRELCQVYLAARTHELVPKESLIVIIYCSNPRAASEEWFIFAFMFLKESQSSVSWRSLKYHLLQKVNDKWDSSVCILNLIQRFWITCGKAKAIWLFPYFMSELQLGFVLTTAEYSGSWTNAGQLFSQYMENLFWFFDWEL